MEVLVGIRSDDAESRPILVELAGRLPVKAVEAKGCGVVGSMSSCLIQAKGDFIVLADDDVELPPNWLEIMLAHLEANLDVLGVAGRDFLQDNVEFRLREARTLDVGKFHWYGKITGNHHLGTGPARRVDILRGSNCLFRGNFLREVGFEKQLRGLGAQVNWELALALHTRRKKCSLFYDPKVEVVHHTAPRHDADQLHRGEFNEDTLRDMFYNEAFVLHAYAPIPLQLSCMAWAFLAGGGHTPGLLKCLQILWCRQPHLPARLRAFISGWMAGWRDARTQKRSAASD